MSTARIAIAGVCPPTTITVSNLNDSGSGSLRQAILDANSCPDANTINFDPGVTGTITLISGLLLTSSDLTINGPGPHLLSVNGNAASRVFHIGPGIAVTLAGLTITNGIASAGGGIYNDHSTLTVSNCTLSGNAAPGNAGGGIFNDGKSSGSATLTIAYSTINGNSAGNAGGGIINNGESGGSATLTIVNSTISGNSAGGFGGGGILNDGFAGTASLQIANSTLSGNLAASGGGIYNFSSSDSATLEIGNTILNAGASGENIFNNSGTVTSGGYNLSSDNGSGFLTATGDQINANPLLGPLQDNDGPTFTHALLPGSPAINVGDPNFTSPPDFEQRGPGFPRVVEGRIDIGAFEAHPPFTVINTGDSGAGSLRQAILDANAAPGSDVVEFAPSAYGTILLASGELLITDSLSLNGPGVTNMAVNGNASNRVFNIGSGITVSIASLTITNGNTNTGAGIYNDHSTLTVSNCTLSGNSASNVGGGIRNDGAGGSATLTIANSILSGNSSGDGGGIYNEGAGGSAILTIVNSTLSGNSASVGGGIHNNGFGNCIATLTIINSTLSGNSASDLGGGILNDGWGNQGAAAGSVQIANSTLSGNSATNAGGGIHNNANFSGRAILTIANSTLSGNSANSGGGIYNLLSSGSATLDIGNTVLNAGASGANILNSSGMVTSAGYNLSSDSGGGFFTATGDQINTDPLLDPLQDNGGLTFTHALSAGSPAINAGDPNFTAPPDFDQRGPGFQRVVDGRIDSGAFESTLLPLTILKQQAKLNFAKPNADGFGLTASLDPGPGFSPANQMLHLDVGGAVFDLTLDEKGSGRTAQGSVKLALNKKTGQWTLTAKFKSGSWQDAWADDGLVNANEPKPGVSVSLPAVVTIGDKTFGGQRSLLYTATADKSGSAK